MLGASGLIAKRSARSEGLRSLRFMTMRGSDYLAARDCILVVSTFRLDGAKGVKFDNLADSGSKFIILGIVITKLIFIIHHS